MLEKLKLMFIWCIFHMSVDELTTMQKWIDQAIKIRCEWLLYQEAALQEHYQEFPITLDGDNHIHRKEVMRA